MSLRLLSSVLRLDRRQSLMVPSLKANARKHPLPGLPSFDPITRFVGEEVMIIPKADRSVVKWAIDQGYPHDYVREYGLPEPALRVRLGLSIAFFEAGRLVHWRADASSQHLDQLMFELMSLFGWCAQANAYPDQEAFLTPAELAALRRPSSGAA